MFEKAQIPEQVILNERLKPKLELPSSDHLFVNTGYVQRRDLLWIPDYSDWNSTPDLLCMSYAVSDFWGVARSKIMEGINRLRRLVDFIEKMDDIKFNYDFVCSTHLVSPSDIKKDLLADEHNFCGSTCCLFGHVPLVFPDLAYFGNYGTVHIRELNRSNGGDFVIHAAHLFFLSLDESAYLFNNGIDLPEDPILQKPIAIERVREFCRDREERLLKGERLDYYNHQSNS